MDCKPALFRQRAAIQNADFRRSVAHEDLMTIRRQTPSFPGIRKAAQQAKVVAGHICGNSDFSYNENFIPSVVYSHPQIARVGYTQKRAEDESLSVEIVKSQYNANIIARAELLGQGFVKAVFHQDKIIGATIVGEDAAELIVSLALAISNELTRKQLRSWVLPHPTLSEIFVPLLFG